MIYGSVCSGIEAASVAWHPLGWTPAWFSEIKKFPNAVLKHHYPATPNLGDMTKFKDWPNESIDVLVAGTPCQSFSVAGLRAGMADPRGNLALVFLGLVDRFRPRWVVWENVPGVHSSWSDEATYASSEESARTIEEARQTCKAQGLDLGTDFGPGDFEEADQSNDFDCFIAALEQLGYGVATSILDAQYFGVPQRRRRVFVVGNLGDWRRAAAVLLDGESLSGNPPPSRETREGTAAAAPLGAHGGSGYRQDLDNETYVPFADVAPTLNAHFGDKQGLEDQHINGGAGLFVTHSLRAEGHDASEDGTGRGTPLIYRTAGDGAVYEEGDKSAPLTQQSDPCVQVVAFSSKDHGADVGPLAPTLRAGPHDKSHANAGCPPAILSLKTDITPKWGETGFTLTQPSPTGGGQPSAVMQGMSVRRLTPRECERLQGFPDDYTLISYRSKPAKDGPRYKALGNSMAVPVMRWIGERINMVENCK